MNLEWRKVQGQQQEWSIERTGHTATLIGSRIYIEGGFSVVQSRFSVVPQHCLIDTQTLSCELIQPAVEPIGQNDAVSYHTATLVDDRILLLGGYDEVEQGLFVTLNARWYDPVLQRISSAFCRGKMPCSRVRHVAGFLEHRREVIVFGGKQAQDITLNDLWALQVDTMEFSQVRYKGKVPSPQSSHMSLTHGRLMYIHCHRDLQLFVLDYRGKVALWSSTGSAGDVPKQVYGGSLSLHRGKILLFGGIRDHRYLNEMYAFDLNSRIWTMVNQTSVPRLVNTLIPPPTARQVAIQVKNKILLIGGSQHRLDETWELHIT